MAGKKQAPAKFEEPEEAEGWEEAVVDTDGKEEADLRMRDWRDVERYREMKELRNLVDSGDQDFAELFPAPPKPKPRLEAGRKGAKAAKAAATAKAMLAAAKAPS